jgi:hydroxymethylbilane synthase
MSAEPLTIGTRGSRLALWQAEWVKGVLERTGHPASLKRIKTSGDKITDVPLAKIGGKGLFVKEIEEALIRGDIHLAVHSMKDVPTLFPDGLHLSAMTEREDPRDALISRNGKRFTDLPRGARIGTSSLRRQSQLKHARPDLTIVPLRGNLDTRLRRLNDGLDAVVLAVAGIKRLGWIARITELLEPELCLPAIGQGALGLECRMQDDRINTLLRPFNHAETRTCVTAERALLKRLEGGCQVPIAAYGRLRDDRLHLEGMVADVDGSRLIRDAITGPPEEAETLGVALAERLLSRGADAILKEIYGSTR